MWRDEGLGFIHLHTLSQKTGGGLQFVGLVDTIAQARATGPEGEEQRKMPGPSLPQDKLKTGATFKSFYRSLVDVA